jgi:O-antigen/teichoic acid export membrane protein
VRRRLINNFLGAALLLPAAVASNYALNVALARLLPVEGFGLFGFVQSLTAVLAGFATIGFGQSLLRFASSYIGNRQFSLLQGLLRTSLKIVVLSSLLVACILAAVGSYGGSRSEAFLWSAVLLPPMALDLWRESAMRGLHRTAESIIPRQVLLPLLTLGIVLLFQPRHIDTVMTAFLSILLFLETFAVFRLWRCATAITGVVGETKNTSEWIRVSIPMALTSLAVQGMGRWDIVIVGVMLGMHPAGEYVSAARTALLASAVLRLVNLVLAPLLAESYHTGKMETFRRLFFFGAAGSAALGVPLYLVVMLFPETVLGLFGPAYSDAALLLQILATAQFVNLVTGPVAVALNMSRYQGALSRAAGLFSVVSLVLTFFSTAAFGSVGAAFATAAVTITMNLSLLTFVWMRLLWSDVPIPMGRSQ